MWWIVTLCAAAFQTSRTAFQHRLRALLSVSGAGFVRYIYGAPIALSAVGVCALLGVQLPSIHAGFWWKIAVGGTGQIVATVLLIRAFDASTFAIGTVFSKTEIIQVSLFSTVFLGERLSALGYAATGVCLGGIALLATKGSFDGLRGTDGGGRIWNGAAGIGLASGAFFGVAAVGIRAASKDLVGASAPAKALVALAVMNTMQTVIHGTYLVWREPGQARLALVHWRSSSVVGVLSVCGSACWALAFVLQNAARVRTFGQVELLFTFLVSHFWFKARHVRSEYLASALITAGVVGVLLVG